MVEPIKVTYKSTNSAYKANQFLQEIKQASIFAADFEAAIKYTDQEIESFKQELENNPTKRRRIELESTLNATALDHPSHVDLTHCSIALNDHEAYVFILDNDKITNLITNFLVTTTIQQIWHNASYDFKHLLYRTKKMPIFYEDSQILAKTILNHTETWKANSSLKELAGKWYGDWGISADNFDKKQMYEEHVLRYAGTDACATFKLWESINNYLKEQK